MSARGRAVRKTMTMSGPGGPRSSSRDGYCGKRNSQASASAATAPTDETTRMVKMRPLTTPLRASTGVSSRSMGAPLALIGTEKTPRQRPGCRRWTGTPAPGGALLLRDREFARRFHNVVLGADVSCDRAAGRLVRLRRDRLDRDRHGADLVRHRAGVVRRQPVRRLPAA